MSNEEKTENPKTEEAPQRRMTLRNVFALVALSECVRELWADDRGNPAELMAIAAFEIADAMLAKVAKKDESEGGGT